MINSIDINKTLETKLIVMRPLRHEDIKGFQSIASDKDLWTWFTHDLSDADVLKNWVASAIDETNQQHKLALAIIDKKTNTLAGSSSLGNISLRDKRIEIGWTWIGREFHGKKINDHSKYLLLSWCFEELGFLRVEFKTDVLNLPARNALHRIGAMEEGILRSHTLMTHDRRRDTIYYSILKHEWDGVKNKNGWDAGSAFISNEGGAE
ncbi:MAG: GNAT family N-acetyltransferase [Cyclobacteriaceae bacterium]|nr:GNAT family N-acetyltransferase [Cyclobacteriaceae bacterium]